MNLTSLRIALAGQIVICLFFAEHADSQGILYQPDADSPIGARNPNAPDGVSQYDFLIGDWDIEVTIFRGEQEPLAYEAKWHNHWVTNGYVVMQEWRGPYSTGIELRSYDPAKNEWQGRNIYQPSPGTWYSNVAKFENNEMTVTTIRTDAEGKETISREIYWDIAETSFRIRTEQSVDGGVNWFRGKYELVAHLKKAIGSN